MQINPTSQYARLSSTRDKHLEILADETTTDETLVHLTVKDLKRVSYAMKDIEDAQRAQESISKGLVTLAKI